MSGHDVGRHRRERNFSVHSVLPPSVRGERVDIQRRRTTRYSTLDLALAAAQDRRRANSRCTVHVFDHRGLAPVMVQEWPPFDPQTSRAAAVAMSPGERRDLALAVAEIVESGWREVAPRGTWDSGLWWQEVGYRHGMRSAARILAQYGFAEIPE